MTNETEPHFSDTDFANLGANDIAYVKAVQSDDKVQFMLMAGDGRELGVAPSYQTAIMAALEHNFQPVSVH